MPAAGPRLNLYRHRLCEHFHPAAMAMWAEKVGQNREWDHKPKIQTLFKNVRHKQGRHTYFYDIWSNIHYGYIGSAAGFSESVLLDGAGLEQIASEILSKVKEFEKYDWPKPTEGIDGLRAWDDDPDRISIGIVIKLYGRYPKGGIEASVVMNEVLQITPDEWGDAVRLHTCFEEAGKSKNDKIRYNDSGHSEKS